MITISLLLIALLTTTKYLVKHCMYLQIAIKKNYLNNKIHNKVVEKKIKKHYNINTVSVIFYYLLVHFFSIAHFYDFFL